MKERVHSHLLICQYLEGCLKDLIDGEKTGSISLSPDQSSSKQKSSKLLYRISEFSSKVNNWSNTRLFWKKSDVRVTKLLTTQHFFRFSLHKKVNETRG